MQTPRSQVRIADDRTSISAEALKRSLLNHLFYLRGKLPETATSHDYYVALVQTVRDRLLSSWMATNQVYAGQQVKRVGYFSSTLFSSATLDVYLTNLGIADAVGQAIEEFGLDLQSLLQQEATLSGSEELGQLATYHLDSLTTLALPAIGYGIRYKWDSSESRPRSSSLSIAMPTTSRYHTTNPWEISRPEQAVTVQFGGTTAAHVDEQGRFCVRWTPSKVVWGIPYDTPVSGYRTHTVNTLRLWSATGVEFWNKAASQDGSLTETNRQSLENSIKIPFLNLAAVPTQQTQLQQQFFLTSCSLQDILRAHCLEAGQPIASLPQAFVLQLNEIHQTIGIVELMRLLLDEHHLDWDKAWQITQNTFVYTHAASSQDASTHWSIKLFSQLLPRHLEIVYEINQRFLADVRAQYPEDEARIERVSLIDASEERRIRIAHLAFVGSHLVNGTSIFQTQLLKQESLRDFYEIFPDKFKRQADRGISHRLITSSNPQLSDLINHKIGDRWTRSFQEMRQLESWMDSSDFCQVWRSIKQLNKQTFAVSIAQQNNTSINTDSLFDVHNRSISQPKRQLLSLFYIITLYNRIKRDPTLEITPRTFIFSEKTEPACELSLSILHLIQAVAATVNSDLEVRQRLNVVCYHPMAVSTPTLYAAADLAEQLEAADTEFVDLDNWKFALNGALTIGTLTAANLRFCEQVGEENCFWFGLTAEEVMALKNSGYDPLHFYHNHRELQGVIDRIATGYFSPLEPNPFKGLIDTIIDRDQYLLLADYPFYVNCQDVLGQIYSDSNRWTRLSILNTARMSEFSCDRIIQEYGQKIWHIDPVAVEIR